VKNTIIPLNFSRPAVWKHSPHNEVLHPYISASASILIRRRTRIIAPPTRERTWGISQSGYILNINHQDCFS
jgi:hypothetical protein